jgi:succinoglycan biosynthesis transport protein ExoP
MDPLRVSPPQETKLHFLDYWRIIRIRKTVILAVFLLVVITATLVTFILPESYSSTAKIRVDRDSPDISLTDRAMPNGIYDAYFIQTEFETIRSRVVLERVIDQMDLNNAWGKKMNNGQPLKTEETMTILKGKLQLAPVRNTMFLEITVYSESPREAADLANAVAGAYKDYRLERWQRNSNEGLEALKAQLQTKQADIKVAQSNVNQLRLTLNVPDMIVNADQPTVLPSAQEYQKLDAQRMEVEAQLVKESVIVEKVKNLSDEEKTQALPQLANDPLLQTMLQERLAATQREITLSKEFGAQHPDLIKVKSQLVRLNKDIDERVKGIVFTLQTRVDGLRAELEQRKGAVEAARSNDIYQARMAQPYFDAKHELENLQGFARTMEMKIAASRIDASQPRNSMVDVMEKAVPGMKPVKPNKPVNIALGIIIGLVVGVGLAFFIEYLDTSVKTIDDVERSLQSPVLGVIPQNVGLLLEEGVDSPHAEAYRVLRTNLLFSRKDDKLNTIAVVSAGAGEGKSTTVFNLASVFAQSKHRVLVVDSDLRRPTLHKMMHVTNSLGLTNYLLKQNTLEEVIQTTSLPTLDFLASGKLPSSSLGILSSAQMRDLITELKRRYDFVFFDSPPIMGVSDASILASEVDMTMQVIQYRRYPQPMNIRAKQLIEKVGGNLVGIVLNNINMSQDESYYYYSGYYHDYYSRNEDQEPSPAGSEDAQESKA